MIGWLENELKLMTCGMPDSVSDGWRLLRFGSQVQVNVDGMHDLVFWRFGFGLQWFQ